MAQRISRDGLFLGIAQLFAHRSTCSRKQVGCVLVREGRIISTGYAGSSPKMPHCDEVGCDPGPDGGCQRTVHAEANTITFAAKHGISTLGSTCYTTLAPCLNCAKLLVNAGIARVVYLEDYREATGKWYLQDCGVTVDKRTPVTEVSDE